MASFDALSHFLVKKAIDSYSDEIALIISYGSFVTGSLTEYSDLDILAIVDDFEKFSLYWPFIYQGKAVEFWSMDWSIAKRWASGMGGITRPWGLTASLFIDSKIIYSRSSEDEGKFETIVALAHKITEKNQANLNQAMNTLNRLYSAIPRIQLAEEKKDLVSGRMICCLLTDEIKNILSYLNNQFYTGTSGKSIQQMMNFDIKIEQGDEIINSLLTASDFNKMKELSEQLITETRKLILLKQLIMNGKLKEKPFLEHNKANSKELQIMHIDLKERINKIKSACTRNDLYSAAYNATKVQLMTSEILSLFRGIKVNYEFNFFNDINEGLEIIIPDLAICVSDKDLKGLFEAVDELEKTIEKYYEQNEIQLFKFKTISELDAYLSSLQ